MDERKTETFESTQRQAFFLWIGLSLALTLFFVQSQMVFVKGEPLPTSRLEWVFIFLGLVTFLLGYFFFRNYTALRKKSLLKMPMKDRKQSLLVAYVFQFVLFETLGLYGVLLSVLTRNTTKAIPFVVFAYIGFYFARPTREKIKEFFI